nr:PREDICTED: FYN-binding protein isoform X1 [Anolis carolinensis]|eukprot:XP_008101055.1 PREDICTED: FYN-binding protein isoform X1 [Anolis carolinensis]
MDAQTNVKSIMAKFSNNPAEEVHNRQVRIGGQPSLVTKTAFEKFAQLENAGPPVKPSSFTKPAPLKTSVGAKPFLHDASDKDSKPSSLKSSPIASKVAALAQAVNKDANEKPGFPKPLGPKPIEGLKQEPKPLFPKPPENRLTGSLPSKNVTRPPGPKPNLKPNLQESEAKPVFPKVLEKISASQENDHKALFPKPPLREKPGLHPIHNEEASNKNALLIRAPSSSGGLKPKVNSFRTPKDVEEENNKGVDPAVSPFPPLKHVVSHQNNLSPVHPKPIAQQIEEGRSSVTKNISRFNQEDSGPPSGAPSSKFVSSVKVATTGPWANNSEKEESDKTLPKRKALPPLFKLGPPPQKPSRPPTVDLERFGKNKEESSNKLQAPGLPPPLPPASPATQTAAPQPQPPAPPLPPGSHPSAQAPPILPPRNIKPRPQENEENYDDAEFFSGGTADADENQNDEGETYEDINEMRPTAREEEKKKEKEEKKRSDQEKKEQKEKEKKEQETRKKFKLVGPIEVIHQARACMDFKGGKNDLSFRQGDRIEIIRITDNPEGKWLGRTRGCYGYIKTTMVEIDYDSLKRKPQASINLRPRQQDSDQEVYDDVGDQDTISSGGQSTTGMGFPPPPSPDIYDGVEDDDIVPTKSVSQDEDKGDSWILKILKGKDFQKKSVRETTPKEDNRGSPGPSPKQTGRDSGDSDVYDDVEPTDFPPPPKEMGLGINMKPSSFGKARSDERDSQKVKKIEKEEKEFRKKFKFEGDIRVLYSTTISQAPSPKKRGSKDLPVRLGESVDVIQNVDDTKVLCRNEEGKYGYVRRSCIVNEDDEIYDDIADGCIYDND